MATFKFLPTRAQSFDANPTERPSIEDPSERTWNLLAVTAMMASRLWDHDTGVDSVIEKEKTIDTVRH
jgi:hypothetical protein